MYDLILVAWAWRGKAPHTGWRIVPIIIVASLQLVLFTAAGIFSSNLFSQTNEVLIRMRCMRFSSRESPTPTRRSGMHKIGQPKMLSWQEGHTSANFALDYSRTCYTGQQSPICSVFAVPSIENSFEYTSCPFDESICLAKEEGCLVSPSGRLLFSRSS